MKMPKRRAIDLAINCIRKEIQRMAVDANLWRYVGYARGEKVAHDQDVLRMAVDVLQALRDVECEGEEVGYDAL